MRFHIIRHGQTHWNVQRRIQGQLDSELDEKGISQAIDRGKDFSHMPIEAAYCSSSLRTRQTISHILGKRQCPVVYKDEFREVNFGIWQGHMWADIEASHPDMVEAYRKALPAFSVDGAETQYQTQARGVAALENLIANHQDLAAEANLLLVSHGAIMKMILAHYAAVAVTDLHKLPPLPNCAHCIIEVNGGERVVTQIAGEPVMQTPWGSYLK